MHLIFTSRVFDRLFHCLIYEHTSSFLVYIRLFLSCSIHYIPFYLLLLFYPLLHYSILLLLLLNLIDAARSRCVTNHRLPSMPHIRSLFVRSFVRSKSLLLLLNFGKALGGTRFRLLSTISIRTPTCRTNTLYFRCRRLCGRWRDRVTSFILHDSPTTSLDDEDLVRKLWEPMRLANVAARWSRN